MKLFLLLAALCSTPAFAGNACSDSFHTAAVENSHPALNRLREFLQKQEDLNGRDPLAHQVAEEKGRTVLHIGYLTKEDRRFSILVLGALKEGSLQEIDAGLVIGTKVPTLLNRLRSFVSEKGTGITIRGQVDPHNLFRERERQVNHAADYTSASARHWTPEDIDDFDKAMRELKVSEGCRENWQAADFKDCGPMSFHFDTAHPDQIHWELR